MGLYNFKEMFVPFIRDGTKTHTIRAVRALPDVPGNTMHLYTGLRHPGAELIGRVPCIKVEPIRITWDHVVIIGGVKLDRDALKVSRPADIRDAGRAEFPEGVEPLASTLSRLEATWSRDAPGP